MTVSDGDIVMDLSALVERFAAEERRFLDSDYLTTEGLPQQGTYPLDVPRWTGGPVAGKTGFQGKAPTILLWAEQGYGDVIQYIRYAPLVAELGASVLVACPPELQRLLSTVPGVSKGYGSWQELEGTGLPPKAEHDLHAPILSLPYIFGTTLDTIPAVVPYLRAPADPEPLQGDGFKIGLVWAGSPKHVSDAARSMPLSMLSPLLKHFAQWYSLQVGEAVTQIKELGLTKVLHDLSPRLHDFADTASVISQLDLVITVDTAVAHLAGALGKPVWILLPYRADWRWLQSRLDGFQGKAVSPWYPTARLFRQPWSGNWIAPIIAVREALSNLAESRRGIAATSSEAGPSAQALPCA